MSDGHTQPTFATEHSHTTDGLLRETLTRIAANLSGLALRLDEVAESVLLDYLPESKAALSTDRQTVTTVRDLLASESLNCKLPDYDLDCWHVGLIITGLQKEQTASLTATKCSLLCVPSANGALWAWLGGEQGRVVSAASGLDRVQWPPNVSLSVGRVQQGARGWRITHNEAKAAAPIATRSKRTVTHCAECIIETAILQNTLLANALLETYLGPLDELRIGQTTARETLQAYFDAGQNMQATAHKLGVDRRTVWHRLDKISQRFNQPLDCRRAELQIALRVAALLD